MPASNYKGRSGQGQVKPVRPRPLAVAFLRHYEAPQSPRAPRCSSRGSVTIQGARKRVSKLDQELPVHPHRGLSQDREHVQTVVRQLTPARLLPAPRCSALEPAELQVPPQYKGIELPANPLWPTAGLRDLGSPPQAQGDSVAAISRFDVHLSHLGRRALARSLLSSPYRADIRTRFRTTRTPPGPVSST